MCEIVKLESVPLEIKNYFEEEHAKYEKKHNVKYNYEQFNFVAKLKDKVVGLISGYTCMKRYI